jgi:hypothetical protein
MAGTRSTCAGDTMRSILGSRRIGSMIESGSERRHHLTAPLNISQQPYQHHCHPWQHHVSATTRYSHLAAVIIWHMTNGSGRLTLRSRFAVVAAIYEEVPGYDTSSANKTPTSNITSRAVWTNGQHSKRQPSRHLMRSTCHRACHNVFEIAKSYHAKQRIASYQASLYCTRTSKRMLKLNPHFHIIASYTWSCKDTQHSLDAAPDARRPLPHNCTVLAGRTWRHRPADILALSLNAELTTVG